MKKRILPLLLTLSLLMALPAHAAKTEASPRIAVIDTGVSSSALLEAERVEQGNNYILPGQSTEDTVGHGTAVASIILGSQRAGMTGLCPTATIVPMVYYTQQGTSVLKGDMAMLAQCIVDAVDVYDCDIINISSGALNPTAALKDAVAYAAAKGVLVVSCSGNDGNSTVYYPGGTDSVLCVGALNAQRTGAADFSNRHAGVDILAPGTKLIALSMKGTPLLKNGTSFATAYASGAAAALMAEFPALTGFQAGQILQATAADLGLTGRDNATGWGALDLDAARAYAAAGRLFRDVRPGSWYETFVNKAAGEGWLSPVSGGTFAPDEAAARSTMWEGFCRASGETTQDVRGWAMKNGVSDGNYGDLFVTRAQMATMFYAYAKLTGRDITPRADLSRYTDAAQIPDYAVEAMRWAVAAGLISGTGANTISPNGTATRAQVATLLVRFCEGAA